MEGRAYRKDRMYAKAYTGLQSDTSAAITGGTNILSSSFLGNPDLNYPATHNGNVVEVKQWIDRLQQFTHRSSSKQRRSCKPVGSHRPPTPV